MSTTFLDWRASSHWARAPGPCRHCGGSTQLLDDDRSPAHKVCGEAADTTDPRQEKERS